MKGEFIRQYVAAFLAGLAVEEFNQNRSHRANETRYQTPDAVFLAEEAWKTLEQEAPQYTTENA